MCHHICNNHLQLFLLDFFHLPSSLYCPPRYDPATVLRCTGATSLIDFSDDAQLPGFAQRCWERQQSAEEEDRGLVPRIGSWTGAEGALIGGDVFLVVVLLSSSVFVWMRFVLLCCGSR